MPSKVAKAKVGKADYRTMLMNWAAGGARGTRGGRAGARGCFGGSGGACAAPSGARGLCRDWEVAVGSDSGAQADLQASEDVVQLLLV